MDVTKAKDDTVYVETTPDDWSGPAPQGGAQAADVAHDGASLLRRVLLLVAGIALVMIGIPMLILPGPGLLFIGGGVACLAAAFGFKKKQ